MHYPYDMKEDLRRSYIADGDHSKEQLLEMLHQDCERLADAMEALGHGCAFADFMTANAPRVNHIMNLKDRDRLLLAFAAMEEIFKKLTGKGPGLFERASKKLADGEERYLRIEQEEHARKRAEKEALDSASANKPQRATTRSKKGAK